MAPPLQSHGLGSYFSYDTFTSVMQTCLWWPLQGLWFSHFHVPCAEYLIACHLSLLDNLDLCCSITDPFKKVQESDIWAKQLQKAGETPICYYCSQTLWKHGSSKIPDRKISIWLRKCGYIWILITKEHWKHWRRKRKRGGGEQKEKGGGARGRKGRTRRKGWRTKKTKATPLQCFDYLIYQSYLSQRLTLMVN